MMELHNQWARFARQAMADRAMVRVGVVDSYDPSTYSCTVRLQPEDQKTGWLPILSPWVGNSWGMFAPPTPGDVVDVHFVEGQIKAGYVSQRFFSDEFRPLPVPAGEMWLVHKSGSYLKFNNDGSVGIHAANNLTAIVAGDTNITSTGPVTLDSPNTLCTGNLTVSGNIKSDGQISDSTRSMSDDRGIYNTHTHPIPGGTSGPANQEM